MVELFKKKPAEASKEGMFGSKTLPGADMSSAGPASDDMTRLASRLKISEERYGELRKKLLLIEQNMLSHHKKAMEEIKVLNSEMTDVNNKIQMVEEKILLVIKELKLTAKREDIDVMKKYVELWNPMRFVTRETVENIVKETIDQELGNNEPVKKEKLPKSL
jgi:hypothetical protein